MTVVEYINQLVGGGLHQLLMSPEPHHSSPEFQSWQANFLSGCKALLDNVTSTISAADTKKFIAKVTVNGVSARITQLPKVAASAPVHAPVMGDKLDSFLNGSLISNKYIVVRFIVTL